MHRSRLLDWADRDRVQGIPSTSVARTVIDLAAVLTRQRLEAVLLRAISEAGLPLPVSEFPVALASGRVAYIDAAYPDKGLAIEVDSYRHHSSLTDWSRDHARSADLVELGWRVLPITTIQLRDDPAEAARAVGRALRPPQAAGVATFPGQDRGN